MSALAGDAGAGGVPLALAADHVVGREDVVLNPYYGHMGGLYGSEYWTYLLPRRVGTELAARLTGPPYEALGARQAVGAGLLDAASARTSGSSRPGVRTFAERIAGARGFERLLDCKRARRAHDELVRPLADYRREELERSHLLLRARSQLPRGPEPVRAQASGDPAAAHVVERAA